MVKLIGEETNRIGNDLDGVGGDVLRSRDRVGRVFRGVSIIAVILAVIIGAALLLSVSSVGVGYVAVVVDPVMSTVSAQGDGVTARYFLKAPWASVIQVYVATDTVNMWTDVDPQTGRTTYGDFPAVPCLTKDGLGVEVDITVRWSLNPSQVVELFKRFPGRDWKDSAIIPIIRRVVRDSTVKFTAMQTIEQRENVGVELQTLLAKELAREPSLANAVMLGAVDLREISLPAAFVKAIEAKLASEQLAIAAEFNRTQILVLANASAAAQVIEAEGAATARILIANATAESLRIIAGESGMNSTELTFLYLTLEALKDVAKTGKVTFLIVTGEAGTWILPIPQNEG